MRDGTVFAADRSVAVCLMNIVAPLNPTAEANGDLGNAEFGQVR